MNTQIKQLLDYVQGAKDILEGKVEGACTTNALLNLDAMEAILRKMSDSPRESVNTNYSGSLEYHVADETGKLHGIYEHPDDAGAVAFFIALTGRKAILDVTIWNRDGAFAYGGEEAVKEYLEDPDASVFERVECTVNVVGKVP